jgi:hypothetical protein
MARSSGGAADDLHRHDRRGMRRHLGALDRRRHLLLDTREGGLESLGGPEDPQLEALLEQLFELAGPDVRRFAVAYKASFPPGTEEDGNALFKMVSRMVRQIAEEK